MNINAHLLIGLIVSCFPLNISAMYVLHQPDLHRNLLQAAHFGNTVDLQRHLGEAQQLGPQGLQYMHDALHEAARKNQIECMRMLLNANVPIDANKLGYTPLLAAVESQLMFITERQDPPVINELNFEYDFQQGSGAADVTPAIEFLLAAGANMTLADHIHNRHTPLGLATKVKQQLSQNDPRIHRVDQLINLLLQHGATLREDEEAEFCTNPDVQSIDRMLKGYYNSRKDTRDYTARCNILEKATRFSATGCLAALAIIFGPHFFKKITPNARTIMKSGVIAATAFLGSWFILPKVVKSIYGKFNDLRRNRIERSLYSTIDRIRNSNPDIHTQNAVRYILQHNRHFCNKVAIECERRLGPAGI